MLPYGLSALLFFSELGWWVYFTLLYLTLLYFTYLFICEWMDGWMACGLISFGGEGIASTGGDSVCVYVRLYVMDVMEWALRPGSWSWNCF